MALDLTVVLVHFNQSKYLAQALASVPESARLIIVDDASSSDEYARFTQIIADARLEVLIHDGENLGISARLNQVLPLIKTTWLSVLAADDYFVPGGPQHLQSVAQSQSTVVWGNLAVVNEDGSSRGYVRPRDTWQGEVAAKYVSPASPLADLLRYNSFITGGMSLLRVADIRSAGGWDESLTTEDFDLWLRLARNHKFQYVDEVIGTYRVVPGSKSRNDEQKLVDYCNFLVKHRGTPGVSDSSLAYLLGMRWALAVARQRKLPTLSLAEMAKRIGVSPLLGYMYLPLAVSRPLIGSLAARLSRGFRRAGTLGSGQSAG